MKTKMNFLFVISLLFVFCSISISQTQLVKLFIMEDIVNPSKVAEYEKAQQDMNSFLKKRNFKSTWRAYSTDESVYYFVMPITSLAGLDSLYASWYGAMEKYNKEGLGQLMTNFAGTAKSSGNMVLQQSEHSYHPANSYLNPMDAGFLHFDFFDIIPGKEMEAWALLGEYKKLCEKNKFEEPFNVWQVMVGNPSSRIIFTNYAKDEVDYYTRNKKNTEVLMKNASDLYVKFMACVEKFSHFNGKPRKDLSYDVK